MEIIENLDGLLHGLRKLKNLNYHYLFKRLQDKLLFLLELLLLKLKIQK